MHQYTEKQPSQLIFYDETKKKAINSQTVRAKENPSIEI